jgi:hypothetical protein
MHISIRAALMLFMLLCAACASKEAGGLQDAGAHDPGPAEDNSPPEETADPDQGRVDLKAFGESCENNAECEGQICLPIGENAVMVCSKLCAIDCPRGFLCEPVHNAEAEGKFMGCAPGAGINCRPCDADTDCIVADAICLDNGQCARDCSRNNGVCESGYLCKPVTLTGREQPAVVCMPANGTCACMGGATGREPVEGLTLACEITNTHGTCAGEQLCDVDLGWGDCDAPTPAAEVCDGVDNNCNGDVDEGIVDSTCVNQDAQFGDCEGPLECHGVNGWICQAPIPNANGCE